MQPIPRSNSQRTSPSASVPARVLARSSQFSPSPQDARYEEQRIYLEDDSGEVEAWRIVAFGIFEEGPSFAEDHPVSKAESQRIREGFGVEEGHFALHFLDLDGSEILRSAEPVPADVLIDAIPEETP